MDAITPNTVTRKYRKSLLTFDDIPTQDDAFRRLLDRIQRFGSRDIPLLLLGESGVGKNVVCQAVHNASRRHDAPFRAKSLASLRIETIESELRGYVRGAYTGALATRKGLFVSAKGGTVLLDELGKVSLPLQYTLLDILESRQLTPMGSDEPVEVDVRLLFAANLTREDLRREGLLCPDLVARVGQAVFVIPPLRERIGDIPLLAERMLAEIAAQERLDTPPELSREALAALGRRRWKGNLRELRSTLACAVADGATRVIREQHLQPVEQEIQSRRKVRRMDEVEYETVREAVESCQGMRKRAARELGVGVNRVRRILRRRA